MEHEMLSFAFAFVDASFGKIYKKLRIGLHALAVLRSYFM